ncbi:hypothetical protein VNI00_006909 [Paramarasmius palmivorus]|uniref:MYND-type domain-containing protein n=1 Tax=Paramarasmius palmivorus TaxID=297713 RepID=A0AAW0D743_9AGAR
MATPIRTFKLKIVNGYEVEAALADCYTHFVLSLPYEPKLDDDDVDPIEQSPIITILTTLSNDLPFIPSNRANGRPRFCMKTYTENEGLLPQLVKLGVLQQVPGGELQNGPVVEVLLNDREISHGCLKCAREGISECQTEDWKIHKAECKKKLWRNQREEAARLMENRRRAEMSNFLGLSGFTTVNV